MKIVIKIITILTITRQAREMIDMNVLYKDVNGDNNARNRNDIITEYEQ